MRVRPADPADSDAIRAVHVSAFPTTAEADLVEKLEREGDAAISLVAEDKSKIVGHVLFSRMNVLADGQAVDALALAPVAVIPEQQGRGIGSELIKAALTAADQRGAALVFVLGEPQYYSRFGFNAAQAEPFECAYAGPYLQLLSFRPDWQPPAIGSAAYAPAFAQLG